jgi:hypothetical protein
LREKYEGQLEKYRIKNGPYASNESFGWTGQFFFPYKFFPGKPKMSVVSSGLKKEGGTGLFKWEHVSVSYPKRCPTWEEMCFIKDIFWDENETVIQFHPRKTDYVNTHKYCLHLWKPDKEVELPPALCV